MSLAFTAAPVAGLQAWLADAFEMQVETIADVLPAAEAAEGTSLNLLEGSRAGLLKLGNQPYEYIRGRFVPMKGAQSDKMPTNKAASFIPAAWLEKLRAPAMAKPISVKWNSFKPAAYGAGFCQSLDYSLELSGSCVHHIDGKTGAFADREGVFTMFDVVTNVTGDPVTGAFTPGSGGNNFLYFGRIRATRIAIDGDRQVLGRRR